MTKIFMQCAMLMLVVGLVRSEEKGNGIPLGGIGAEGSIFAGKPHIQIDKLTPGSPGERSGLKEKDLIIGAFSEPFSPRGDGYAGAPQDLALAIERAEAAEGKLDLRVLRPGKGEIALTVKLPNRGAFGPAYPLGSDRFSVTYEYACQQIADHVNGNADQGFHGGWFGLCLLGHPKWKTVYAKPIIALRDVALRKFTKGGGGAFAYAPVEDVLLDGKTKNPHADSNNGGPNNWDLGSWTMFLAEYRRKTKDTSVDDGLQRAAEMCANRIQWWKQPPLASNGYSPEFKDIAGIVSHGGVTGDYIHIGWGGGINAVGVHIFSGLALAKQAGVKMDAKPRDGHYFGFPDAPAGAVPPGMEKRDFTLSEKFDMQLAWLYRCSGNDGAVGYTTGQGGSAWDASARTSATFFALMASGRRFDQEDTRRVERMKDYLPKAYARMTEAHAYAHGGLCFYQLALPFLDDRSQRYIMENWRLYYSLSQLPNGTVSYIGCLGNNGGDYYLGYDKVTLTVWALTGAVANGGLPYIDSIPDRSPDRVYVGFTSPHVRWPRLETRTAKVRGSSQDFKIDVYGAKGDPLKPKAYKVAWSSFKGTAAFSKTKDPLTTKVSFSAPGTYRLLLTITHKSYTLQEPIEVEVVPNDADSSGDETSQKKERPTIVTQPVAAQGALGGSVSFSIEATGRGPLVYDWRLDGLPLWPKRNTPTLQLENIGGGQAGSYDCVVTGPDGVATSKPAVLEVADVGSISRGGLWLEHYTDPSVALCRSIDEFVAQPRFPRWSDSSAVLTGHLQQSGLPASQWTRVTGWLTPPNTGRWKFHVTGSGMARVSLSSDDSVGKLKQLLVYEGAAKPLQWSVGSSSAPTALQAGRQYFIEVLHFSKESDDAHVAITWVPMVANNVPGTGDGTPIDGSPALELTAGTYRVGGIYQSMKVVFPDAQPGQ